MKNYMAFIRVFGLYKSRDQKRAAVHIHKCIRQLTAHSKRMTNLWSSLTRTRLICINTTLYEESTLTINNVVFGVVNVDDTLGHPYAINYLHSSHN